MSIFILSEQRLKNDFNDVINLQSSTIQQATRTAQDIYLRSIIGDYLLETLEDMILNDTLTGDYKLLIDNYCIPYLEYRTMAELQMSTFKINNAGANQVYDSNVNTLSVEQVKYLEQQYINKASYYENRMTKYLIQSGIPEYKMRSGITNASTTITEQTGIFLGGTKTKTTNRTTTNKNSLVGAVRYDKEQNLSEQEKEQARENIGVSGDIDINLDNYYTKEETYSKEEVNDLVANSGGGSDTPSNMPIVDIMSLTYEEQVELIDFVFDNNRFPDINTLYTYQGYVLNNLTIYSDWWDEALNQRYVVFSLYAHPKSYDIRFITYQWNEGKIYNDINEKDFNDWLVTNGEINNKLNTLSNGLVLDLFQYDNDELAHVYNKIYYMGEQFTDKPITYRGKFINNITIEGENVRFWHYAITTDSNNINSDKSFYVDVEMYDDIMGLVRTIYTEIGDCTVIGGNGGGTTDLSNYYTKGEVDELIDNIDTSDVDLSDYYNKEQVDTLIAEIPTFSGDYNDLNNKPDIYTKQETYSKDEVDSLVANSGGSDSNMPIVDIMSLPYDKQLEIIDFVIDNNTFPNINTLYTYQGYVLNNLPISSYWWNEELNQRYVVFSLYDYPKSYDIRFITYEWYENVIYNDINEKQESDKLVRKGEVDELIDSLDIPTLPTLSNVATSGNYSDLNNLPTLFDGNYNSLSDKPTIPTATSQLTLDTVYSKSEIDLQFAEINTTLGNINNILNTI